MSNAISDLNKISSFTSFFSVYKRCYRQPQWLFKQGGKMWKITEWTESNYIDASVQNTIKNNKSACGVASTCTNTCRAQQEAVRPWPLWHSSTAIRKGEAEAEFWQILDRRSRGARQQRGFLMWQSMRWRVGGVGALPSHWARLPEPLQLSTTL